jgi:aryl-alcohol dehydrogenase-like predicted oxidoreductase
LVRGLSLFLLVALAFLPDRRFCERVDYIDLFLIHDPYPGGTKRLETYKALLEAQTEGKIRNVGVSN